TTTPAFLPPGPSRADHFAPPPTHSPQQSWNQLRPALAGTRCHIPQLEPVTQFHPYSLQQPRNLFHPPTQAIWPKVGTQLNAPILSDAHTPTVHYAPTVCRQEPQKPCCSPTAT
ncbi:hypothetical protein AAVH_39156, partial [Aphelenchoides avenae]